MLVLHGPSAILIVRVKNALRHENFYDIKERRIAIQVEPDFVQDEGFLRHQLVLLAIEAEIVLLVPALEGREAALVNQLVTLLLRLSWFVARELP